MEKKEKSMMPHAMKVGAFIGLGLIIFSVLLYAFGINSNEFQFLGYLIMAIGIFMGIKPYRDKVMEGYISYGNSLKIGVLIALFSSFIFNFYTYFFYKYIDPSQLDALTEQLKIQMANQGKTEEEMDLALRIMEKFLTPGWLFISGLFGYTFVGFLFSLIISIFLKKENTFTDIEPNQ